MTKTLQVNTYLRLGKPNVTSTQSVYDWLNLVKQSQHSETITKARQGELDYNTVKQNLPCVTFNFLYDGYKKDSNIIGSTGLLYIDIDSPDFDINTLDKEKVFSFYHSFGGKGYAIIVRVDGLTKGNFKSTYLYITDSLGITDYIDKNAIKASQYNVLSFDSNIYINSNPHVFKAINFAPLSIEPSVEPRAYTPSGGAFYSGRIRFDNIDEIEVIGDYVVNWDGYEIIKCYIPFEKVKSNRNKFLLSYCANLVYLNPTLPKSASFKILSRVNQFGCETPVDSKHIRRVVDSVYKYHEEGTLKPHVFYKKRKIIFNKSLNLSRKEKFEIFRKENSKRLAEASSKKLYDIIEGWDFEKFGKISQRKIYPNFPISKKTVEKYYPDFKDYIKQLNSEFKSLKTNKKHLQDELARTSCYNVSEELYPSAVVNVYEFLPELFQECGLHYNSDFVMDIITSLNSSKATIEEVMHATLCLCNLTNNEYGGNFDLGVLQDYISNSWQHIMTSDNLIAA